MTLSCHKLRNKFTKNITVYTNDPTHSLETLVCRGEILEGVKFTPNRVNFGSVSRLDKAQTKTITITRGDGAPLKPKLHETNNKAVTAELKEITPGERYEIAVTATPPFTEDQLRTNIRFDTGVPEVPTTNIPIMGRMKPLVEAKPRRFVLADDKQGDWKETVELVWDAATPGKIIGAETTDPAMSVQVDDKDGKQTVTLMVPRSFDPRIGAQAVTLKIESNETPTVKIPISVASKPRSGADSGRAGRNSTGRAKAPAPTSAHKGGSRGGRW